MEEALIDVLKWFSRSDPLLAGCILALGSWIRTTNKKIDTHVDLKNSDPHPTCVLQRNSMRQLCSEIESIRQENREDHKELFEILRGRSNG